jgi:PhnB protein
MPVNPVPNGFHSITPHLVVRGAAKAIEFYKQAFGAESLSAMSMPGSDKIMHATIKIGDSMIMLADDFPEWGSNSPQDSPVGSGVVIHIYTADTDGMFQKAVTAGAIVKMPPMDMFWGDRYAQVTDPFGHRWSIGTHVKDVAPEEMAAAAKQSMSGKN